MNVDIDRTYEPRMQKSRETTKKEKWQSKLPHCQTCAYKFTYHMFDSQNKMQEHTKTTKKFAIRIYVCSFLRNEVTDDPLPSHIATILSLCLRASHRQVKQKQTKK